MKIILSMAGLLAANLAQAAPLQLTCTDAHHDDKAEAKRIEAKAKGIVSRKGQQLTIKVQGRTIVMKSLPSEDMDGTYYRFCDRKDGYILIAVLDEMESHASLIHEASGKVMPGGVPTLLADDRRTYFAQTHSSGMDADTWNLHVNGREAWTGMNGFTNKEGNEILAAFSAPAFNARGQLTATAQCYSAPGPKWTVTLEDQGSYWAWTPEKKCRRPR